MLRTEHDPLRLQHCILHFNKQCNIVQEEFTKPPVCSHLQLRFHQKATELIHDNIITEVLGIFKRNENTRMDLAHVRSKGALTSG
jgi:hypothetical protein